MTSEMTKEKAIDLFEKAHTLQEQLKLGNDIQDINNILNQHPINMYQVREKIVKVNEEHPENVIIFHLISSPGGNRISLAEASGQNLIDDLDWKRIYLRAKKAGKAFDEFREEMRKNF